MTFYVRAARRRATLGRERGASPPALCAALHLSSFLTSPQSWMLDSQVDRLAEGPEACARGVPRRVGFGQLLAGERTAVCTNAPPRRFASNNSLRCFIGAQRSGSPELWHHSSY